MNYEFAETYEAPIDELFACISDGTRAPEWEPAAIKVDKTTPGPIGVGTLFRGTFKSFGRMDIEIAQFEPSRRVVFTISARQMEMQHAFTFHAVTGGTRVEELIEVRPKGIMWLMLPLMGLMLRRTLRANSRGLKSRSPWTVRAAQAV